MSQDHVIPCTCECMSIIFDKPILFMLACVRLSHKDTPGRGPYAACYAETKRSCITGVARSAMKWIAGKLVSYLRGVSLHGDHKTSAPVPLFYRPVWNVWSLGKPTEPCYHTQWMSGLCMSLSLRFDQDVCPYCYKERWVILQKGERLKVIKPNKTERLKNSSWTQHQGLSVDMQA